MKYDLVKNEIRELENESLPMERRMEMLSDILTSIVQKIEALEKDHEEYKIAVYKAFRHG